jgi:hypothetical protein
LARTSTDYVALDVICHPQIADGWSQRHITSCATKDLKTGPFKPEYAGKMNFYLAAVDDMLKHPSDNPTIGLILCKSRKKLVVEYALRNTATPMGIAEFRHLEKLPAELKGSLPTLEEIEAELELNKSNEM